MTTRPPRIPTATYRLQLSRAFTLADTAIACPPEFAAPSWIAVLIGEDLQAGAGGLLRASPPLTHLPVAALVTRKAAA